MFKNGRFCVVKVVANIGKKYLTLNFVGFRILAFTANKIIQIIIFLFDKTYFFFKSKG